MQQLNERESKFTAFYDRQPNIPTSLSTTLQNPTKYRQATLTFKILRRLLRLLLRILFKIEVRGLENLRDLQAGGYILAGNHLSYLDPFLVLVFAPVEPRVYFIGAREEVQANAFRRFVTEHIGGVIPVERGKGTAHRQMAAQVEVTLAGGGVLGIFPEGTVSATETGALLPFKKGVGYFAARSGRTIVPVAFSGTKEFWLRKHIVMVVGEPLEGRKGGREVAEELTAQTASAIQAIMPTPTHSSGPKLLKNVLTNLF